MILSGDGSITGLVAGGLPDATVTQPELAAGVAGTGPAFRAYKNTAQAVSDAVVTKVTFTTEVFDTANAYDAANSKFQPTVAGYYQIIANVYGSSGAALSYNYIQIFKNGVADTGVVLAPYQGATAIGPATTLTYLNGSTDYVEIYAALAGTGALNLIGGANFTFFSAALVRGA
jgi:hypothetical protein